MSNKDVPAVTQEVVTQVRSPFTVGKIRELAHRLRDEPENAALELKAGGGMFTPSTLTYRKPVDES